MRDPREIIPEQRDVENAPGIGVIGDDGVKHFAGHIVETLQVKMQQNSQQKVNDAADYEKIKNAPVKARERGAQKGDPEQCERLQGDVGDAKVRSFTHDGYPQYDHDGDQHEPKALFTIEWTISQ